jgi:hypothetical protein
MSAAQLSSAGLAAEDRVDDEDASSSSSSSSAPLMSLNAYELESMHVDLSALAPASSLSDSTASTSQSRSSSSSSSMLSSSAAAKGSLLEKYQSQLQEQAKRDTGKRLISLLIVSFYLFRNRC